MVRPIFYAVLVSTVLESSTMTNWSVEDSLQTSVYYDTPILLFQLRFLLILIIH